MRESGARNLLRCLLILTASCSSPEGRPDFRTFREDGVLRAVNSGTPRFEGELFRYEKILEIPQQDDRPETLLNRAGSLVHTPEGEYLVIDRMDGRVVRFSANGDYLDSFGSKGGGPGGFGMMLLQACFGDSLYLYDPMLHRTTLYRADGILLDVLSRPSSPRRLFRYRLSSGGVVTTLLTDQMGAPPYRYHHTEACFLSADMDTLALVKADSILGGTFRTLTDSQGDFLGRVNLPIPFSGIPGVVYTPWSGVVMSDPLTGILRCYDQGGRISRIIESGIEREAVTEEEADRIRERYEPGARPDRRPEFARAAWEALEIPERKGLWEDLIVDDEGYMWLQVVEAHERRLATGGDLWDVFEPAGRYLGRSRFPLVTGPGLHPVIQDGRLQVIQYHQDTGTSVPTVYRLVPEPEGFVYP